MKAAKIILIVIPTLCLLAWIQRSCHIGHIARTLPFCGGWQPDFFDVGAIVLIILCIQGFRRLKHRNDSN